MLAGLCVLGAVSPVWGTGLFIAAPTRVDAVYDAARGLVYVSTSDGQLLRYDVGEREFLAPLVLSSTGLVGLAISPDGSRLAVANRDYTGDAWDLSTTDHNGILIVNLDDWSVRSIEFRRTRGEIGTYMVEFVDDTTVLTSSSFSGSGWVPLRRVDLTSDTAVEIASVRQATMLSSAADRSVLLYAESNISSGEFGVYNPGAGTFRESGTGWFLFEGAANRDGTQFALPTYNGMYVYDQDLRLIERLGIYASTSPIGAAYHPTEDILYLTWWGTNEAVQAYDANTLTPIGVIDDTMTLGWSGNGAFRYGRTRLSADGSGLTVTVDGGVKLYSPISFVDDDADDDGIADGRDNCVDTPNPDQADTDGDGTGDACNDSDDVDGDEWADELDNCVDIPNDQSDLDGDGLGDLCDPFPNRGDHLLAQCESDLDEAEARIEALERDLAVCRMPPDEDHDGVCDENDTCAATMVGLPVDAHGCSHSQFCAAIEIDGPRSIVRCARSRWLGAAPAKPGLRCRIDWSHVTCRAP